MPSIALVIAVHQGAATLEATLASIAAQSVPPDQLIVIDGGSTDGTVDIIRRHAGRIDYWKSEPDGGLADAWNKALRQVASDWIWFLGCDDRLADEYVIERWRARLDGADPAIGIVYARVAMVTASGRIAELIGRPWRIARRAMRYRMTIPHSGMLSRKSMFDRVGPFDPRYPIAADYDWTLRALDCCDARFFDDLAVLMGDSGMSGATRTQIATAREYGRIAALRGRRAWGWYWLMAKALVKGLSARFLGRGATAILVDFYRIATLRKPRLSAR